MQCIAMTIVPNILIVLYLTRTKIKGQTNKKHNKHKATEIMFTCLPFHNSQAYILQCSAWGWGWFNTSTVCKNQSLL